MVQEILDRANVGRSTFYMHFRDKDGLLVSGIQDMLGSVHTPPDALFSGKPYERIVTFSPPIFEHIAATFILVLNWWADCRPPLPPAEADAILRALVMPTLTAALQ